MSTTEARKDPLSGRWRLVATTPSPVVRAAATRPGPLPPPPASPEGAAAPYVVLPEHEVLDKKAAVDRTRIAGGLFTTASSAGRHERIVESRDADAALETLPPDAVEAVARMYRDRMLELKDDNRSRQLAVVKNHGAAAGAVVAGSTSEVFALPFVPDELREMLTAFNGHYRRTGSCVLCDMVRFERTEKARVVDESLRHIAFCPWASRAPYEILIAPKGHHPNYLITNDAELGDFANLLRGTLARVRAALDAPAYRYTLFTAPLDAGADAGHFHWHVVVKPMLEAPSALDGILDYNPVPPEHAATHLAEAAL